MRFVDFCVPGEDETVATVAPEGDDYLMWEAAGLYLEDSEDLCAHERLETDVAYALQTLERDPGYFRLYNRAIPGAGTYEDVLDFLNRLKETCEDYPYTVIKIRN